MEPISRLTAKKLVEKWTPVLESCGKIEDESKRISTAMVLENTDKCGQYVDEMMAESYSGIVSSAGSLGTGTGTLGATTDYGPGDSRIPSILVPTIRRFFPQLIAHELCGVQPMAGPLAFAFAIRHKYGVNGRGVAGGTQSQDVEQRYLNIDDTFTGAVGKGAENLTANFGSTTAGVNGQLVPGVGPMSTSDSYWQAFAGSTAGSFDGRGAELGNAEWWKIGEDMPMNKFNLEKGVVVAKTRKLGAGWSLELGEDVAAMHGINVDSMMAEQLSYEIKSEIDRQIIGHMVKTAIVGGSNYLSTWSPVSADGRDQLGRIGALYTQMIVKSQLIAKYSQRGSANRAVVSPTVAALLARLRDMTGYVAANPSGSTVDVNVEGTVAKVGTLAQAGMNVYRDIFAKGEYILLGYKGNTPMDAGIIYCPYIPFQLMRAVGPQDFSPRMGCRTRYGVLDNLFGSANYYQFIKVEGLTDAALAADGGRVFLS